MKREGLHMSTMVTETLYAPSMRPKNVLPVSEEGPVYIVVKETVRLNRGRNGERRIIFYRDDLRYTLESARELIDRLAYDEAGDLGVAVETDADGTTAALLTPNLFSLVIYRVERI